MANVDTKKGAIGILTGGGDVPGLNPVIRGVTLRAIREGYQVIGICHSGTAYWMKAVQPEPSREKLCDLVYFSGQH